MEGASKPGIAKVVPHPPLREYYKEEADRREFLDHIFDTTALHYDWINRVMSFGSGIWYRREALKRAGLDEGMEVLDLCIGSAQVARPALELVGSRGTVTGLDASMGMLIEAQKMLSIPLVKALVEAIPLSSERYDFLSMGYALRHVTDLVTTFREYLRVLKPGGTVLILEFTRPSSRLLYHVARFYLRQVVPTVARFGTRSKDSRTLMRYFWDTIDNCVPPEAILGALTEAGFEDPKRFVLAGIFSEYTARRPSVG